MSWLILIPIIWLILLVSIGIFVTLFCLNLYAITDISFMFVCSSTILINLLIVLSWHSGSTNLSNLWDASDWISYLTDLPIIASGLKKAHSIRTVFVSEEHDVSIPPTIPARLITLSSNRKTESLLVRLIFFSSNVLNSWSIVILTVRKSENLRISKKKKSK